MSEPNREPIDDLVELLKRQRDELKLKMHLAGKDAQDEWDRLERKWKEVEAWAEPLTSASKKAARAAGEEARKVTGAAMDVAAREIKHGYDKLRSLFD